MDKGEIWLVKFPDSNGHEQRGTRPVIILADTGASIVIVVPMTSNIQALRFPHTLSIEANQVNGLKARSIALIFQVRAIDKKRLKHKIGNLRNTHLKSVNKQIRGLLGL